MHTSIESMDLAAPASQTPSPNDPASFTATPMTGTRENNNQNPSSRHVGQEGFCSPISVTTAAALSEPHTAAPVDRAGPEQSKHSTVSSPNTKQTPHSSVPDISVEKLPFDWKEQMITSVIADIERAEFVALDLEFSGLFTSSTQHHTFQKYFQECVESVKNFMTVQLGVCPVWRSSNDPDYQSRSGTLGDDDVWCMAPYNFHVFPSSRRIFLADSSTLSWLLENGFSFDDWIQKGFDYARLALLQNVALYSSSSRLAGLLKPVSEEGLQRIISAIVDREKPIVVHNGLLDILHIHDKFIDALPASAADFFSEWVRIFTGGVYDTKHIAMAGKYSVMQLSNDSGTVLSSLYTHLRKLNLFRSKICLAPRHFCVKSDGTKAAATSSNILMTGHYHSGSVASSISDTQMGISRLHEAGFDAFITAQIFLMENELFHVTASNNTLSPTRDPPASCQTPHPRIPLSWRTSDAFGSRFQDVLELVKISPGKIDLKSIAQARPRPCAARIDSPSQEAFANPTKKRLKASAQDEHQNTVASSSVTVCSGTILQEPIQSHSSTLNATAVSGVACSQQASIRTKPSGSPSSSGNVISSQDDTIGHAKRSEASLGTESGTKVLPVPTSSLPSSSWAVPLRQYLQGVHVKNPVNPQNVVAGAHPRTAYSHSFGTFSANRVTTNSSYRPVFPNRKIDLTKKT